MAVINKNVFLYKGHALYKNVVTVPIVQILLLLIMAARRRHTFSVKSAIHRGRLSENASSSSLAASKFFADTKSPKNTVAKVFASPKSNHGVGYRLIGNKRSPTGQSVVRSNLRAGTVVGGSRLLVRHSRRRYNYRHHMPGRNSRGQFVKGHH